MAPLYASVALAAMAHRDIETAHQGPPDNLFLILGFAAFRFYAAAAMRAALGQRNRDSFIRSRWDGAACLPAVAPARFAAWPLRVDFWVAPRMWGGLTLADTQCGFQFPAQPLQFLLQALVFLAQPFVFLLRSVQLPLRNELDALGVSLGGGPATRFHSTLR